MSTFDDVEAHREANDMWFGAPDPLVQPDDSCELCGEPLRGEVSEFYEGKNMIVAHVRCGEAAGMEQA